VVQLCDKPSPVRERVSQIGSVFGNFAIYASRPLWLRVNCKGVSFDSDELVVATYCQINVPSRQELALSGDSS
jgi:hypothetical protein